VKNARLYLQVVSGLLLRHTAADATGATQDELKATQEVL
jgi:hypothetical protein